ncbi:MAG: hypothetical protein IKL62_04365 [Clostridia bacterium]|nr:hypothetical protein [Clostridia bacterium]
MPRLKEKIIDLIIYEHVDKFYIGNQGRFDYMASKVLDEIKMDYPFIVFSVVLAYMPQKVCEWDEGKYINSEYPEVLANVPRRFAIDKRNRWMLEHSDFVITHVTRSFGGAAKFKEIAERKNKRVINI